MTRFSVGEAQVKFSAYSWGHFDKRNIRPTKIKATKLKKMQK